MYTLLFDMLGAVTKMVHFVGFNAIAPLRPYDVGRCLCRNDTAQQVPVQTIFAKGFYIIPVVRINFNVLDFSTRINVFCLGFVNRVVSKRLPSANGYLFLRRGGAAGSKEQ